jgi:hypothetical protein
MNHGIFNYKLQNNQIGKITTKKQGGHVTDTWIEAQW